MDNLKFNTLGVVIRQDIHWLLIETSNITAHFVEETNDMYLDVFSCKPFDEKKVEDIVGAYFGPVKKNKIFLNRQA